MEYCNGCGGGGIATRALYRDDHDMNLEGGNEDVDAPSEYEEQEQEQEQVQPRAAAGGDNYSSSCIGQLLPMVIEGAYEQTAKLAIIAVDQVSYAAALTVGDSLAKPLKKASEIIGTFPQALEKRSRRTPTALSEPGVRAVRVVSNDEGDDQGDECTSSSSSFVQCDNCNKWHKLPHRIDGKTLPDKWYCSMADWAALECIARLKTISTTSQKRSRAAAFEVFDTHLEDLITSDNLSDAQREEWASKDNVTSYLSLLRMSIRKYGPISDDAVKSEWTEVIDLWVKSFGKVADKFAAEKLEKGHCRASAVLSMTAVKYAYAVERDNREA